MAIKFRKLPNMLYEEKTKKMYTADGRYTGFTFEKGEALVNGVQYNCHDNTAFATLETAEKIQKLLRVIFPNAVSTIRSGVVDPPLVYPTPQLRVLVVDEGQLIIDSNAGLAAANIIAGGVDAIWDEVGRPLNPPAQIMALRDVATSLGIITNVTPLPQPEITRPRNAQERED